MELAGDRFSGFVPHEGRWQAILVDAASGRRHALPPLEVAVAAGAAAARVEIEVPDGRAAGR